MSKVLGPKLVADSGEWGTYAWSQLILGAPGGRIAGGSDEVMRNIVGERVLVLVNTDAAPQAFTQARWDWHKLASIW